MNRLKQIQYNCRQATFLIEKKQVGKLTIAERLQLKIHLAGCSVCKTFQRQSIFINYMVHSLWNTGNDNATQQMDASDKLKMQERIAAELKK